MLYSSRARTGSRYAGNAFIMNCETGVVHVNEANEDVGSITASKYYF
jgi:hypothetical protein